MKDFDRNHYLKSLNVKVSCLVVAVLICCLLVNYLEFWNVGFWRHDSMYYELSYLHKVSEEGRWINYLLSPMLRTLPAQFAIACIYLSLLYFIYVGAVRASMSKSFALILSLIAVQIPFLQIQLLWPVATLPSFLVLALAAFLANKISPYLLLPLFSVLFFGTMSHLYFLLPILFLRDLDVGKFFRISATWITSFILGFLVTQAATHLTTGHFIEIASWRNANKINNFSDVIENTERVLGSFFDVNIQVFEFLGAASAAIILLLMFIDRNYKKDILPVIILGCSALAIYFSSIYLGLAVAARTAFVYVVCLLFLVFVKNRYSNCGKFISLLVALLIGLKFAVGSYQSIAWYAGVTGVIKDEMGSALPEKIDDNTKVHLSMSDRSVRKIVGKIEFCEDLQHVIGEGISTTYRIGTALRELGVRNVYSCSGCDAEPEQINMDSKQNCKNKIFRYKLYKPNEYILIPADSYLR